MVINLLMLLSLVAGIVFWLKTDRAATDSDHWDCVDVVRHAEAVRRFKRWRLRALLATIAYVVFWYVGGDL